MKTVAVVLLTFLALLGFAQIAMAGPGCPDKPGVCAPGNDFPW